MIKAKQRYTLDFPAHMADCEFNYYRLLRLMPAWQRSEGNEGSAQNSSPQPCWHYLMGEGSNETRLVVSIERQEKYTTMLHIAVTMPVASQLLGTYTSEAMATAVLSNAMTSGGRYGLHVRLYHDANVAELIQWDGHDKAEPRHSYPNANMYQTDEKAQHNRFLGELLAFCLTQGRVADTVV